MGPIAKQWEDGVTDAESSDASPLPSDVSAFWSIGLRAEPWIAAVEVGHPILPVAFGGRGPSFPFQGKDHVGDAAAPSRCITAAKKPSVSWRAGVRDR
jgi:hypothetical protein